MVSVYELSRISELNKPKEKVKGEAITDRVTVKFFHDYSFSPPPNIQMLETSSLACHFSPISTRKQNQLRILSNEEPNIAYTSF